MEWMNWSYISEHITYRKLYNIEYDSDIQNVINHLDNIFGGKLHTDKFICVGNYVYFYDTNECLLKFNAEMIYPSLDISVFNKFLEWYIYENFGYRYIYFELLENSHLFCIDTSLIDKYINDISTYYDDLENYDKIKMKQKIAELNTVLNTVK